MSDLRYGKPRKLKRRGKLTRFYYVREYDRRTGKSTDLSTGCANVKDAREWVATRVREQARGIDRRRLGDGADVTFDDAFTAYLAAKQGTVSAKYLEVTKTRGERFWLAFFGGRLLGDIQPTDVQTYLRERRAGVVAPKGKPKAVSASTVNSDLRVLRSFLEFCRKSGWIETSPAVGVDPHRGEMRRRTRTLSRDEEDRLIRAVSESTKQSVGGRRNAGGRQGGKSKKTATKWSQSFTPPSYLRPLTITALYSGLRRRTLLSIRWRDIDLGTRHWSIPAEFTKTGEDYVAPASKVVVDELLRYRGELALEDDAERLRPDARIFGLDPDSDIGRAFRSAVKRAELEGMTFHDCRRVFLNRLRDSGVTMEVAMRLTGHRSVDTVLKFYREIPDDQLVSAVDALEQKDDAPTTKRRRRG